MTTSLDSHTHTNTCSICNTEMPANVTRCSNCKAQMIKGYLDKNSRKRRRWIIFFLLVISSVFFYYVYPTTTRPDLVLAIFLTVIALSFVLPITYFKLKSRNQIIWKRKKL